MKTTISEKTNELATIANSGIDTIEKPKTIAKAAPRAAPEATPKVSGETSGFPKHPCIKAPAVAKATPPIMAINILGNLYSQIMADCKSLGSSNPKMNFTVVKKSKFSDEPIPSANNADNIVKTASKMTILT